MPRIGSAIVHAGVTMLGRLLSLLAPTVPCLAAATPPPGKPAARISMPPNNALVRGDVPVFGVASAPHFKQYRLEFGEGASPARWHVIKVSRTPQSTDPWAAGKVRWDPNRGARGNLATWHTGLTSYAYGRQTRNLNGVYTLRLVVEDQTGATAEARVVVNVARAITREKGGIAESRDGKAPLNVAPYSTVAAGLLVSIQAVDPQREPPPVEIREPKDLMRVGSIYEFRPPGLTFMRPVALRIHYDEEHLQAGAEKPKALPEDKLGLYAYQRGNDPAPMRSQRSVPARMLWN